VRTEAADNAQAAAQNKLDYQLTIRLTHFEQPASRIFWKMTGPLKPPSESPATSTAGPQKLYDRRGQKVLLEDMERIRY
jgi:hypothetical protein